MLAIIGAPCFIDSRNGWMLQTRQGLSFALKQLDVFFRNKTPAPNHLQRYRPARVLLFSFINNSHTAFTQLAPDSIAANLRTSGHSAGIDGLGSFRSFIEIRVGHGNPVNVAFL